MLAEGLIIFAMWSGAVLLAVVSTVSWPRIHTALPVNAIGCGFRPVVNIYLHAHPHSHDVQM